MVARRAFTQLHLFMASCNHSWITRSHLQSHVLVTSRLNYSNMLYMMLPLKNILMLQLVQNIAARAVMCTPRATHSTLVLHNLQFRVLVLTFKALQGTESCYQWDHLSIVSSAYPNRPVREGVLQAPLGMRSIFGGS